MLAIGLVRLFVNVLSYLMLEYAQNLSYMIRDDSAYSYADKEIALRIVD